MPSRRIQQSLFWFSMISVGLAATGYAVRNHATVGVQPDGRILVPTAQMLTPAGTHIEVNDRPLGMVLGPDHHTLAVVTGSNFASRALHLIDVGTRTLKQTIAISNSFVGVAFSPTGGTIYVGGGASNDVKIFAAAANGTFAAAGTIPLAGVEPSGLSISLPSSR